MDDRKQLFAGEGLPRQGFGVDLAIAHENRSSSFQDACELWGPEQNAHDQPVDCEQAEGPDDAAGDGAIVSNDGVLNRVRKRQQNDQIKRVQLRQLAPDRRRLGAAAFLGLGPAD